MDGVLSGPVDGPARVRAQYPEVEATPGLKVEHRGSRFGGTVLRMEKDGVVIRGRSGQDRLFRLGPGAFDVDRKAVTLVRPKAAAPAAPVRTASGSPVPARIRSSVDFPHPLSPTMPRRSPVATVRDRSVKRGRPGRAADTRSRSTRITRTT